MSSSTAPVPPPGYTPGEVARLNALTDRVVAARRAKAAAEAAEARALADAMAFVEQRRAKVSSTDSTKTDLPIREVAAELAAAVRASDRTIQARLDEAATLVNRFPATLQALATGQIERGHVVAILDAGHRLDDAQIRDEFECAALEVARRESPGRTRPIVRGLAQRLDPISLGERHVAAMRDRGVWVRDGDDGMSELCTLQPTAIAHGILDRLTQQAKTVIDARTTAADAASPSPDTALAGADTTAPEPDARSLGQVRADVLADVLLTGHATAAISDASIPVGEAIVAHVQVTIPAATLTGDGVEPAELAGRGPIDPVGARRLAATAPIWLRLFTDPATGCTTAVDQYRAPLSLRRLLAARDEHCRFPGCRQPVRRCDLDHTVAREHGGPTEVENLAHLCRRHHVLKHNTAWRVRQRPGGILEWTSPTGRVHPDLPARTVAFTSVTPPEPPPPF